MDTQAVRTTLEQLLRELDSATQTLEAEGAGETSELSHITQHPGDVGTEVADNDREIAVLEAAGDRRAEVQAALDRLSAGTYGVCVDCGQQIGQERLEYRPEAARCLPDQEKHESATG
ncbi:MAG TPA: TraR/DksA C4-type zinc finger protein [Mycobacteriales bacterium]|nr:TraR/DksA C4-type zinc finger protein [Mycobacteriales bacterium]